MTPDGGGVSIGRDPNSTIPIAEPSVSWTHATVVVEADRHLIVDAGSANGTFVNGLRVRRTKLEPGDIVQVGPVAFSYDGQQLVKVEASAAGIDIDVRNLGVTLGNHAILGGVELSIQRNEFVGIIGGSGSGKSTLLRAISGVLPPTTGQVLYNGLSLHASLDAFRPLIGYVPQRDIVHPQLTVGRALDYAARLRLPTDWASEERADRIRAVVDEVGLSHRIVHPISKLSGGQLKRVSVALELLGNPRVLFLDEPTSGLDPGLDKRLMSLFRELADGNRTVVVVTHTTTHLDLCDRIIMLAPSGHLVYDGAPNELPPTLGVESYADAFSRVEGDDFKFEDSTRAQQHRRSRRQTRPAQRAWPRRRLGFQRSYRVVAERNFEVVWRDKRNLLIMLTQAPVIGLIVAAVGTDRVFSDLDAPFGAAQTMAFALAIIAIWFGLINAIRDVVKERAIIDRERLAGLRTDAYVLAKATPLLVLTALQCLILLGLASFRTGWAPDDLVVSSPVDAYVSLTLVGFVGVTTALLVSALSANDDQAASTIPFLLIPQFLLAGVVFALGPVTGPLSRLMLGRWGAEAMGGSVAICEHLEIESDCSVVTDLSYPVSGVELLQIWIVLGLVSVLLLAATALALELQRARV